MKVNVSGCGTAPGSYTLTLETFDNNSTVKTALKTDVVSITINSITYIRDSVVPTALTVDLWSTKSFTVDAIYSTVTLCNALDIRIRQPADEEKQLGWVTLTQGVMENSAATVEIDTGAVASGIYTLTLESFDNNSAKKPTLRTDYVQITIPHPPPVDSCIVSKTTLTNLSVTLENMPVRLEAIAGMANFELVSYKDRIDLIANTILTDEQTRKLCGAIKVELVTDQNFI